MERIEVIYPGDRISKFEEKVKKGMKETGLKYYASIYDDWTKKTTMHFQK